MNTGLALAASLPLVIAWLAVALLRRSPIARRLTDHPNARSLHSRPTPRVGGLGIIAGVLPFALASDGALAAAFACAFLLAIVSALDDARGLPIAVRLPAHLAAATVFVLATGTAANGAAGQAAAVALASVIGIAWMANLFNFMDGSDGLAGGMAAIGFATLALGAASAGETGLAIAAAAIASASAGFLGHNLPPAKAFLGDAGSVPLGFLAAALGLLGVHSGAWPLAFPLLAFSPFIVDATYTLLRRLARGERIWIAHRTHGYQRLVLAGWSPGRLAATAYALMAAACACALLLSHRGPEERSAIIAVWIALYALILAAIAIRTRTMSDSAP